MSLSSDSSGTPRGKHGRFQNPWPGIRAHGLLDFLRWTVERSKSRRGALPRTEFGAAKPGFAVPRAGPETLTITWVGHTTTLLQLGSLNVLTDPVWSDRASPLRFIGPKRLTAPGVRFRDLPVIDAVVISHNHYDHLDSRTVQRLIARFPAAAWRVPLGVAAFIREKGAFDVEELGWHETTSVGPLTLTCVPAQHFSGRSLFDRNKTLWCGWVLASNRHSLYFAGDTALNPSFAEIGARYGPFDAALMPIGAYDPRWFMRSVHMDPEECVSAYKSLTAASAPPPLLLATHWGTFRLTDEPLDEPPKLMRKVWRGASLPSDKLWIARFGETRIF